MLHYQAVKGMKDILPGEIASWQYIEGVIHKVAGLYGFQEIRTPALEYTELFQRSIGMATDIVGKEMFTFKPEPDGKPVTLRPEMTAGVVRAFLQGNLAASSPTNKLYYITELFRKERPQAGRQRQFSQFGAELLGASSPEAVAEVIGMMMQIFTALNIEGLQLKINTLGDRDDRARYSEALRDYFTPYASDLDEPSRERLQKNPLRILDSKNPDMQAMIAEAPKLRDFLDRSVRDEFEQVLHYLDLKSVAYHVDPLLVRGLDYYCHTAFEVISSHLGAQDAIGGGGRYDDLAKELGNKSDVPAVGFAVGMERLLIAMEKQGLLQHIEEEGPQVYVVVQDRGLLAEAVSVCDALRGSGISSVMDLLGRSIKAQMREANRMRARYALFVGHDEVTTNSYGLKNLGTSEQESLPLGDVVERLGTR